MAMLHIQKRVVIEFFEQKLKDIRFMKKLQITRMNDQNVKMKLIINRIDINHIAIMQKEPEMTKNITTIYNLTISHQLEACNMNYQMKDGKKIIR